MTGLVGVARLEAEAVALDCGCSVVPSVLNADHAGGVGKPHTSGGAIVICPDHGIRHGVTVAEVVVTVRYAAHRIDPPDPSPETEALFAALEGEPHVYTVAAVLHGVATAPCTICGAGRNGSRHVVGDDGRPVEATE